MGSGGMIQIQRSDGSWKDAFPVGYKTHNTAEAVARKTKCPTRVVDRAGQVLYQSSEES